MSARPSPANGFRKQIEKPRLSIREAVARWGDDWMWFGPREFSHQQIQDEQDRKRDDLLMRCCEQGTQPRIREWEIEDGERLERASAPEVGGVTERECSENRVPSGVEPKREPT